VYKSSPSFSTPGDKPEITPAVLPTLIQCSSSPRISWPTPSSCTLCVPLQSCLAMLTIILTECTSNPTNFALPYLLIDVYLTGHFPQLFIRYDPGPPDLHDISQASVCKGLKLSLDLTCNQPGLAPYIAHLLVYYTNINA
jgi:hypothetical protein